MLLSSRISASAISINFGRASDAPIGAFAPWSTTARTAATSSVTGDTASPLPSTESASPAYTSPRAVASDDTSTPARSERARASSSNRSAARGVRYRVTRRNRGPRVCRAVMLLHTMPRGTR